MGLQDRMARTERGPLQTGFCNRTLPRGDKRYRPSQSVLPATPPEGADCGKATCACWKVTLRTLLSKYRRFRLSPLCRKSSQAVADGFKVRSWAASDVQGVLDWQSALPGLPGSCLASTTNGVSVGLVVILTSNRLDDDDRPVALLIASIAPVHEYVKLRLSDDCCPGYFALGQTKIRLGAAVLFVFC